jgi:hypothetical protein
VLTPYHPVPVPTTSPINTKYRKLAKIRVLNMNDSELELANPLPIAVGTEGNDGTSAKEGNTAPRERWFGGIRLDLAVRLPLYMSDWTVASSEEAKKIAAATLFAYFTSVLPAVIFGDELQMSTDGVYGLTEVLLSTGGMGILYSVFAGQGLVIVGVTGPVVFFQVTVRGYFRCSRPYSVSAAFLCTFFLSLAPF